MGQSVEDLINFLKQPDSFPDKTRSVRIVQTHASVVAICDSYVYKVKKPVNFEFLDFSTLEKRKFYCEEELRLNSRLTDNIYVEVLPIYCTSSGLMSFSQGSVIAEYALKMRRMASEGFLSTLIRKDEDYSQHYQMIVDKLSNFYLGLSPQELNPEYGTYDSISFIINENRLIREQFLGRTLQPGQEEVINKYQEGFLRKNKGLLDSRVKDGWVRDVHGDLRLEHFHLEGRQVNIYDCIEFKERLRVNDVINDLAFLCMELEYVGRFRESLELYQKIMNRLGDELHEDLWRFYKVHRACVRGMVHAVAGYESEIREGDRLRNQQLSKAHFGLATRYVQLNDQPLVIVVFGGTATGKSTIASNIAAFWKIPHIQSDVVRKSLIGLSPEEVPDGKSKEMLYTPEFTDKTYNRVVQLGQELLKRHNAVVLDARWPSPDKRELVLRNFPETKICWIQATADLKSRKKRLLERERTPSVSDARLNVLDKLIKTEQGLTETEDLHMLTIDSTDLLELNLEKIINWIAG